MPLLTLCDPGFCPSVGVSKPAGASVADCWAVPATPIASTARNRTITGMLLRPMVGNSPKVEYVHRSVAEDRRLPRHLRSLGRHSITNHSSQKGRVISTSTYKDWCDCAFIPRI